MASKARVLMGGAAGWCCVGLVVVQWVGIMGENRFLNKNTGEKPRGGGRAIAGHLSIWMISSTMPTPSLGSSGARHLTVSVGRRELGGKKSVDWTDCAVCPSYGVVWGRSGHEAPAPGGEPRDRDAHPRPQAQEVAPVLGRVQAEGRAGRSRLSKHHIHTNASYCTSIHA